MNIEASIINFLLNLLIDFIYACLYINERKTAGIINDANRIVYVLLKFFLEKREQIILLYIYIFYIDIIYRVYE